MTIEEILAILRRHAGLDVRHGENGFAVQCECGELSHPVSNQKAALDWHDEHIAADLHLHLVVIV